MERTYLWLLGVLLVLAGGFYYSPRAALASIDQAVLTDNQAEFDKRVNLQNLRELATSFIEGKLELKRRIESRTDLPTALRDYTIAMGLREKVVNSLMTPRGFAVMTKGNLDYVNNQAKQSEFGPLFAGTPVVFDSLMQARRLVDQDESGLQTTVLLRRNGLFSWRVEVLDYPVDAMFDQYVQTLEDQQLDMQ